jgi:hypothetical protein
MVESQQKTGRRGTAWRAILSLFYLDQLGHGSRVREREVEMREENGSFLDSLISLFLSVFFLLFIFK